MDNNDSYIGKSIDRYTFNEIIGKGAMDAVYKAFDQKLLRPVAIKVTHIQAAEDSILSDRIIREAQIVARVEHANIVPIYDVVHHEHSALIVMRLLRGENLGHLMHIVGKALDVNEALKLMYQVMLAMDYAHSKGIVHADLKPENIFISSSNEIFVLDFGLAAIFELEKPEKNKMYGTPLYMSPEQCNSQYLDARSDIYSLGLILYQLLTGLHPFTSAKSIQQLLLFQREKVPQQPDKINPSIPKKLSECIMRALEKDPKHRFYSCRDFFRKIEDALPSIQFDEIRTKELRWDPRAKMNLQAQIRLDNDDKTVTGTITDLSVGGASILSPVPLSTGDKLKIDFDILGDNNYISMSCQASVMWTGDKDDNAMTEAGVSFNELKDIDKQYLGYFVRDLLL